MIRKAYVIMLICGVLLCIFYQRDEILPRVSPLSEIVFQSIHLQPSKGNASAVAKNTSHLVWKLDNGFGNSLLTTNSSETTKSWDAGWTSWLREQKRRKNVVHRFCDNINKSKKELLDLLMVPPKKTFSHFLVDDARQAIYCFIPKVACTNWKKVWMILRGLTAEKNLTAIPLMTPHLSASKMKLAENITDTALKLKLRTYTKLLIVRHPLHRLASAYRDKIQPEGDSYFQKQVLPYVETLRPNAQLDDIQWPEFVDYVTLGDGKKNDVHWNSYIPLCHPCAIEYDVIAKMETLIEDSERFLRLIGAPADLHFPNTSRTSRIIDGSMWEEYEQQLSSDQLSRLYEAYKRDFQLFGYD